MMGAVVSNGVMIFAGVTDNEASVASAGDERACSRGRAAEPPRRLSRRRRTKCKAALQARLHECGELCERQGRTAVRRKRRHAPGGCAARRIPKGSRVVQPPGATRGLSARTCHGLAREEASSRPETLPAGTRTAAEGVGCRLTVRNEQGRRAGSSEKHPHGASRREAARRVRMFRPGPVRRLGPASRPPPAFPAPGRDAAASRLTDAGSGGALRDGDVGSRAKRWRQAEGGTTGACPHPRLGVRRRDHAAVCLVSGRIPPRCSPRYGPGSRGALRQHGCRMRKRAAPPPEQRCGPRCAAVRLRPSSPGCRGRAPCRRGSR